MTPRPHCRRSIAGRTRCGLARLLLSLLVLLTVLGLAPCAMATPATFATFAPGSLIVPMDATYQNYGMFKSYGLTYKLLQSGVPVRWAIGNPKSPDLFNGVDFQATTIDRYTRAPIGSPYSYRGGAFIIDSTDVAVAAPIINAWRAANSNQPTIHEASATFMANVDITLRSAPRIALEAINAGIAIAYFNAAGIPDNNGNVWSTASPNILNVGLIACNNASASTCPALVGDSALYQAGGCLNRKYDVFVTPHNGGYSYSKSDPTNVGTQAYAELDNFVNQGGGWIALCHSILSNENAIVDLYGSTGAVRALFPSAVPGGFLTQFGFPAIDNVGGTWNARKPDLPLSQAVPTTPAQTLPGGSVQTWHAPDGTASFVQYWSATERVANFATATAVEYDWALNGVYHNGAGSGKMTYLGGHSYSTSLPYNANYEAPYLRFFYNALFFNGSAVASMALQPSVSSVSQGQVTPVQLVLKNTGSSTAINVGAAGGVTITLKPQVTYVSTAVGPSPGVAPGAGGTTILTWGNLGNVEGGAAALAINTTVAFPATGSQEMASIVGSYGDNFEEQFTNRSCTSILVNPAPAAAITKTPDLQGPVSVGSVVTWTLAYSNPGSAGLLSPSVDDILPTGLQFLSATPPPTYTVPAPGGTRVRWTLPSPLAAGGSGSITVRASVQTATGQPFTNSATFSGTDAANVAYSASDSAAVLVTPPEARLDKAVSPSVTVNASAVLTYTLSPSSPGPTLLNGIRIFDAPPQFTTYVNNSANQGGSFGAYAPIAAAPGTDPGPGPATNVSLSVGATPFTVAIGDTVTVTMVLTNNDPAAGGFPITGVVPSALVPSDTATTCATPTPPTVANIAVNGGSATITYTCTIGSLGEISFDAGADGTYNGAAYSFAGAESNTVLGVGTTTGTNVVTWKPAAPNSNTPDTPSVSFAPNTGPGVFALDGGTATWERYNVTSNTWISSPASLSNLPGNVADGGALVYDGLGAANGYVYAFQGGSTAFWRYKISTGVAGTWAAVASAPAPVGAGGALAVQNGIIYALQGSSTAFWKYDPAVNLWTGLAPLPTAAAAGAALASAGPFIYALQGNNTNKFLSLQPDDRQLAGDAKQQCRECQGRHRDDHDRQHDLLDRRRHE